jgi:dihydrodipicolinate synthase/N-acetylneuraminate lyase
MAANSGSINERFKGLILPLPTVFDGKGEIDVPAIEKLTDWYMGAGVHGFFVLGSQGQGPACTIEQRMLVADTVLAKVGGRLPVVIQIGAVDPYTSMELARHARQAGADGIGIVGPYYYSDRSEWEIIEQHKMVDSASGLPMLLYNNPQYAGYPTPPEMMVKIREAIPGVFGAKLALGSLAQAMRNIRVMGPDFNVFIPITEMLPGMLVGVAGSIASGVPITVPEVGVAIVEAIQAGDIARAQELQLRLLAHSDRIAPLSKYGRASTLVGLRARGLEITQYPRWPVKDVPAEDQALMARSINQLVSEVAVAV